MLSNLALESTVLLYLRLLSLLFSLLWACAAPPEPPRACEVLSASPSDDPADWQVDTAQSWVSVVSEPTFIIPGDGLPVTPQAANNNVAIAMANGRLFVAWRTAPNHFASAQTELHVISSATGGPPWTAEATFALGTDVREPAFLLTDGVLSLSFFEAGSNPGAFEPRAIWHATRCNAGDWTSAPISDGEKVAWDVKTRDGIALRTSYSGDHYGAGLLDLHLERSDDGGATWAPFGADPVSVGGDSEAAFEIGSDGTLWAVTRNEDGDATGAGSKVCSAPAEDWSDWTCSDPSDPERYDSPELVRHGDDLYLLARRDVGGPFGPEGDLLSYSLRPKRSALYRLDQAARKVEWIQDIPGVGDTAFVSAWRTEADQFVFANYTSPLDTPDLTWLEGQTNPLGTQIYLATLDFVSAP
jgi:hypothetical protein